MRHYLLSFAATFAAATIGSAASIRAQPFYAQLQRPEWAPPSAVFGPVWTAVYLLIAVAGGLALARAVPGQRFKLGAVFCLQLALNGLWSWLFFAWRHGGLAFIDIVVLSSAIVLAIVMFWRVNRVAGALLLPYLAWVLFAATLNFAVWQMNPQIL